MSRVSEFCPEKLSSPGKAVGSDRTQSIQDEVKAEGRKQTQLWVQETKQPYFTTSVKVFWLKKMSLC